MSNTDAFIPVLYIGIGETCAFYTLRENSVDFFGRRKVMLSYHIQNLSQDIDVAIAKATEYAEKRSMPISYDRNTLLIEMREIKRTTKEELEKREAARQQRIVDEIAAREKLMVEYKELVNSGIMPIGRFTGHKFEDIDVSYMQWMMTTGAFKEDSILYYVAQVLREKYQHLLLPTPSKDAHYGVAGKRVDIDVTVIKSIPLQTLYGASALTIMVESTTNACITVMSSAWAPKVGLKLSIRGTIKGYREYNGQQQTVLSRVKTLTDTKAAA